MCKCRPYEIKGRYCRFCIPKRLKKKKKKRSKLKDQGGRPTVITNSAIAKLKHAFSIGSNTLEACQYAGVSKDAFYNYRKGNEKFKDRIEQLKTNMPLKARQALFNLIKDENPKAVTFYLERKLKSEFGQSVQLSNDPDNPVVLPTIIEIEGVDIKKKDED